MAPEVAKESFSVFQLPDGRWKATAQVRDRSGLLRPKQIERRTETLARRAMDDWLVEHGRLIPSATMSVDACCEAYIRRCEERGRKDRTLKDYRIYREKFIKPTIGHIPLCALTVDNVDSMIASMPGIAQKVKVRSFLHAAIHRIGRKADPKMPNVVEITEPVSYTSGGRPPITEDEFLDVMAREPVEWKRALFLLIASNGLRPSEARQLIWPELEERKDGMWLRLRESKSEEGKKPVAVPTGAAEALRLLPKASVYVFPNPATNRPYHERTIAQYWTDAVARTEIEGCPTLYSLRHMFGRKMAARHKDHITKRVMRHTDIRTTKQYYTDLYGSELREAVE